MIGETLANVLTAFAAIEPKTAPKNLGQELGIALSESDLSLGIENPDPLIGRKGMEIIDEMRQDDALGAFMDMKKSARLSTDWNIVPASDENEDVQIAEFVKHVLMRMQGSLKEKLRDMMTAMEYGYSITNKPIDLIPDGEFKDKIGYLDFKTKEPHNFSFDMDRFRNVTGLIHDDPDMETKTLEVKDFIVYTYRKEFGNPYGRSDFNRCYWAWNSKKHIRKFWDIYLERYAGGYLDVEYEAGREKGIFHEKAQKFIKDIQQRTGWLHPSTYKATYNEASGKGAEVFEKAIAARNVYNARAVLVPDLLGISAKPSASLALGKKHFDVFLWVLNDIGEDISETIMFEQVIKPIVDLNFANVSQYPRFEFEPLSDEQKFNILTQLFAAVEKGVVEPDAEIENAVRKLLGFALKQEKEEPPVPNPKPRPEDEPEEPEEERLAAQYSLKFQLPKLQRRVSAFERKVNFQSITETMDELQTDFIQTWSDIFKAQRRAIIDFTKKRKIVSERDSAAIEEMPLPRKSDMQKSLARYMLGAYYSGSLEAQGEIERGQGSELSMPAHFQVPLEDLPLDKIEEFFLRKGLVVTPAIKFAAREIKREAFFITGVESEKLLSRAKMVIFRGMKKGDQNWTELELKKLFDGYLEQGLITDAKLGEAFRIETIARTNFTTAFNEGRKQKFEDPDVADFIVAYQYSAILDDATTDYCAAMDGRVFRKEELNGEGFPPAHHNCRSIVVPITEGESFSFDNIPGGVNRGSGFEMHREAVACH